ncbi:MAG: alpha/beta fold hydrolase [SAR324 cluster bacterium]|nr:alpha/beta fold hydrolase [SAR324 cluster bacterium]
MNVKLEDDLITQSVFHPRQEEGNFKAKGIPTAISTGADQIGGYLHVNDTSDVLLMFFHGNGEIAADYDMLADYYTNCGVNFWVLDYRGYGRSSGAPSYSCLSTDAEILFTAIPEIEKAANKSFAHILVMGRSLGSAPAIYLASKYQEKLSGLVLDSAFAYGLELIHRIGGPMLSRDNLDHFMDNIDYMKQCSLPTLLIHGTNDRIIPFSDARALYKASPSDTKKLIEIPGAGHNDMLYLGAQIYFYELKSHIFQAIT